MTNPKVSIIIPVYKAEKYLHRCVDSLLAQTYQDFEVLLIDDGSPDNSGLICDEYASKDPRIKVYHKENGGVSRARQLGIDNAQGEFTIHVDSDDWIESNMLEELIFCALVNDADMVICDYLEERSRTTTYRKQEPTSLYHEVVLKDMFGKLAGSCCNKLVRHSCYTEYNVNFPEDVANGEDWIFNIKLLKNDIKVAYLNKAFYHYLLFENTDSLTRKDPRIRYREDEKKLIIIKKILDEEKYSKECNQVFFENAFFSAWHDLDSHDEFRTKYRSLNIKNASSSFLKKTIVYTTLKNKVFGNMIVSTAKCFYNFKKKLA